MTRAIPPTNGAVMPWAQTSAGVEEWVPDPTGSDPQVATPAIDAPARKLSLAEQIAATRAKQASAKAEASEPTTEPAKPRKLSLAEQIAATRARAAGGAAPAVAVATREQLTAKMEAAAAKSEAEAAARAERFRVKEEATAAADLAEAVRESEAAREAAEVFAVEADRVALAEMEASMVSRKLSLAEQIAMTRDKHQAKGSARAREAVAAAAAAREQAVAAGTSAADPSTESLTICGLLPSRKRPEPRSMASPRWSLIEGLARACGPIEVVVISSLDSMTGCYRLVIINVVWYGRAPLPILGLDADAGRAQSGVDRFSLK